MTRTRSLRNPAIGIEALQLFGIVAHDASAPARIIGAELVPLRELAAVIRLVPYSRIDATSEAITEYRQVVESRFQDHAVIPAPFGTVFKSRSALLHWMELHYVTLADAFGFIGDRLMARVRVAPRELTPEELTESREVRATDFETTVFDSFRFMKRTCVACVTLAPQGTGTTGRSVDASFLIERDKWSAFADAVGEERQRLPELSIEQSGPLPPYDFVRLQFGA